jgi:tetratricopeptide (TPR) repeat protein
MDLTRFWHHNLKWALIIWIGAAIWFRLGWLVLGVGIALWFIIVYLTAPGVLWTYLYALPFVSSNPIWAMKALQKAVDSKTLLPFPYIALGVTCLRNKRWDEAIPLLKEAERLSKRKSAPDVKNLLAVAYRETGQYDKAYALLDELVSWGIRDLKIYYNYALCYLQQKRFKEALDAAETARSFNENQLEPVLLVGRIYFEMGNIIAAKDNWEWAINRKPEMIEPYYWLGRAELELGETEAAIAHLKLAAERIAKYPSLSNVSAAEAEEWLKKAEAGR